MKKLFALILIAAGFLGARHSFAATTLNGTITATTSPTATSFTVNYHYTGAPTASTPVYSWLTNTVTGAWVDQSNLLITLPESSSQITKDFSVTYDFSALNLTGNGTKYAYYLADGTTSSANLLYGAANFTVGTAPTPTFTFAATGQYAGQAAGTYQEGFKVTPSIASASAMTLTLNIAKASAPSTVISTNSVAVPAGSVAPISPGTDDLALGSYVATLMNGLTSVGTANFTLTSTVPTFEMEIASLLVPSTAATFKGTITATRADVPNGHLVLKIGTSPSALTLTKVAYDGDISLDGVEFTVVSDNLDPSVQTQYYYGFTETTTGATLSSGSFFLNTAADQSAGPIAPAGAANPAAPASSGPGCAPGPFSTSTPASSLCSSGTANAVNNSTSNWTWTCGMVPYPVVNCSATVTATAAGTTNPSDPSDFLQNPLSPTLNSFPKIFAAIMNNVVMPIAAIALPLALIYCGFLFVVGRKKGTPDGIQKARDAFKYTIIGAILILGATVIANALQGTVTSIFGTTPTASGQTAVTTTAPAANTSFAANPSAAASATAISTQINASAAATTAANQAAAAQIVANNRAAAAQAQAANSNAVAVSSATNTIGRQISGLFYSIFH